MSDPFGGFSENWEAFNAALVAMSTGRRDEGLALAKGLLGHIRRTRERKSRHWIRPRLVPILRRELQASVSRAKAA